MEPLYTSANVKPAYQLRWSLSLFANKPLPPSETWLPCLKKAVEPDSVRILDACLRPNSVLQFFVSTRPQAAPPAIVKSVKGRLQHAIQPTTPNAFRRNFLLAAVGDATRQVVEEYVASQVAHHPMADARVQADFETYQLEFPDVDLSHRQTTGHGAYRYNLHLVLVHEERSREVREAKLSCTRDMVLRVARNKQHRVSRLALLPDHLHLVTGVPPRSSPEDVALAYLNNLAYAHGMKPLYSYSYYVGTVGELDSSTIRLVLGGAG